MSVHDCAELLLALFGAEAVSAAEAFAAAGFAVELPLLPGHGTSLEDMLGTRFPDWAAALEVCYLELAGRCDEVVVAGLSMGGTLAAWLATSPPSDQPSHQACGGAAASTISVICASDRVPNPWLRPYPGRSTRCRRKCGVSRA